MNDENEAMIHSLLDSLRTTIPLKCGFHLPLGEVDVVNGDTSKETVFGANVFDQLQYFLHEKTSW